MNCSVENQIASVNINNKKKIFFVLSLAFILFNLVFLFNNWSMLDDWQVYQMKDKSVHTIFDFKAIDRFFPGYQMFFWSIDRIFGSHLFVFYLVQNILLLVSLIVLYKFSYSLTKSWKISAFAPLLFLGTTSFGENFCRLGTPQPILLPFLILLMVISFNFIFRDGKKTNLILIGLLFLLSFLTNESAAFILPSFFIFFVFMCILREKLLLKKTFFVLVCLFIAFAIRMILFFCLGGKYFTGKGYVGFSLEFRHLLTSLLYFSYSSALIFFLIISCSYLYYVNKKYELLSRKDKLQLIFMVLFTLCPLFILMFWRQPPKPYLLLPFIPPIFIAFAVLYTSSISKFRRVAIHAVLIILMLLGTALNIRFFIVFFSRNNAYQNMLAYVSEITTRPDQRVLLNLDRGGWLETYNSIYYYLKNRYEKEVYIGSFVPVSDKTIFLHWDKNLAEEGLASFKSEKEDVIVENDIIITFPREAFDLTPYYSGKIQLKKKFESLTWLTSLSHIKQGKFFDKEYWSVYVAD